MSNRKKSTDVVMEAIKSSCLAHIPVMIVGQPGVGKTATIKAWADEMDYELITLIGSRMDPTDITGLPKGEKMQYLNDDGSMGEKFVSSNLMPEWQFRTLRDKKVILFFDEFSNTAPSTRASFLSFVQDREFNDGTKLPEETIIIACMNPSEEAADGYELDFPTTNRFIHIAWNPEQSEWFEGMETNWGKPFMKNEEKWKKKIVSFIKTEPALLQKMPNDDISNTAAFGVDKHDSSAVTVLKSAWPSRRSWDNLSRALAIAESNGHVDSMMQDFLAEGLVGSNAAVAFRQYLKSHEDGINIDELIDHGGKVGGKDMVDWTQISVDQLLIVANGLFEKANEKNILNVVNIFGSIAASDKKNQVGSHFYKVIKKYGGLKNRVKPSDVSEINNKILDISKMYRDGKSKENAR